MVGQRTGIEVGGLDRAPAEPRQLAGHRIDERFGARRHRGEGGRREVGSRDDLPPKVFRQSLDEGRHQLGPHPGYEPVETDGLEVREQRDGDAGGDAVLLRARLELVGEGELDLALAPRIRVVALEHRRGVLVHHGVRRERQQVGLLPAGLLPPRVEVPGRDRLRADPLVVEVEQGLVVDDDVAPARAVFEFLDVLEQRPVVVEELVLCAPFALYEAWRMNSSRETSGSIRPYGTGRWAISGMP